MFVTNDETDFLETQNTEIQIIYLQYNTPSSTSLTGFVVAYVPLIALFHYVMGIIEFASSDNNRIQLPPLNGYQY